MTTPERTFVRSFIMDPDLVHEWDVMKLLDGGDMETPEMRRKYACLAARTRFSAAATFEALDAERHALVAAGRRLEQREALLVVDAKAIKRHLRRVDCLEARTSAALALSFGDSTRFDGLCIDAALSYVARWAGCYHADGDGGFGQMRARPVAWLELACACTCAWGAATTTTSKDADGGSLDERRRRGLSGRATTSGRG